MSAPGKLTKAGGDGGRASDTPLRPLHSAARPVLRDRAPPAPALSPPERFTQTFSRWRPQDQEAFLDLNADVVERWIAARAGQNRKRA